jgi:hypothetical protein
MTRVFVHAGFHKTGTTSLQNFMTANSAALAPWCRYYGKTDFPSAGAHARTFAQRPFPWRLWPFRRALRRFFDTVPDGGTIVLSRETFSGGMPGHRRLTGRRMTGYGHAARPLARVIVGELRRRFGPETEIAFVYTTREREAWLASVHGHLLRSIRMTEPLDQFRAAQSRTPAPEDEARGMARHLAPIPVHVLRLEDAAGRAEGPASGLLDLIGVPAEARRGLKPPALANAGQDAALRDAFLDLNRRIRDKRALREAKEQLLKEHGG